MASKWTQKKRPPRAVVASVAIHTVTATLWFIYYAATGRYPQAVGGWVVWLVAIAILALYLRAIYVGYNWARWLSVALVVLGIGLLPLTLPTLHTELDRVLRLAGLAVHVVAAVLLFVPSSGQWYRSNYSFQRTRYARR